MINDVNNILPVNVDGIPNFVKVKPFWAHWIPIIKDGKARKVPSYSGKILYGQYWDNEGHVFTEALKTMPRNGGLELLLSMNNDLACIDIDDCSADDDRFKTILGFVPDAWCEFSPSGHGIHIWGYLPNKLSYLLEGRKTIGYHGKTYEWYGSGRGITVTGHKICGNNWVDLTDAIKYVESLRPLKVAEKKRNVLPIAIGIQAILDKAFCNEPELARMYKDGHSWEDKSAEDFRFCQRMWFWLGGLGAGAIEDVFRNSALYRESKGSHYISITVTNAGKRWNGKYYGSILR